MRNILHLLFTLLLGLMVVWATGCGGSKQTVKGGNGSASEEGSGNDYDEIEKLLGIDRESSNQSQEGKKDDDLIRLLEADEGKQSTSEGGMQAGSDLQAPPSQAQPAGETVDLERKIKQKDLEIADLKAQLMQKNSEIDRLKKKQSGENTNTMFGSLGKQRAGSGSFQVAGADYINEYNRGLDLFKQRQYRDALAVFESLLASDTDNDRADNAQYWIGECYYAMGRYREAILAFEKVFTFRYSNKNDYAQFKIGQSYFKLGDKQRARQEFQQFLDNYQNSRLVNRAQEYLAQL